MRTPQAHLKAVIRVDFHGGRNRLHLLRAPPCRVGRHYVAPHIQARDLRPNESGRSWEPTVVGCHNVVCSHSSLWPAPKKSEQHWTAPLLAARIAVTVDMNQFRTVWNRGNR